MFAFYGVKSSIVTSLLFEVELRVEFSVL